MTNVFWGAHGAVAAGANGSILAVGDSWLWYPLDNLAVEIGNTFPQQSVVVVGSNGSEAAQWSQSMRKDIDFAFDLFGEGAQALLLSGGGNDIAGMADFLRLLKDDCAEARTVEDCFRLGQPEATLTAIVAAYQEVIVRFRARNPQATVLMHNYDHAWPNGQGLFGPADWLRKPMTFARVPEALQRPLVKELLDRLHRAQAQLAARPDVLGPMVAVRSGGTLPDDDPTPWWANELHPTPKGFRRLVKKAFAPALRGIPLA